MHSFNKLLRYLLTRLVIALPNRLQKAIISSLYPSYSHLYSSDGSAPLFNNLYLELRTRCNSTICSFCPATKGHDIRPDITMSFELYSKIIQELADHNYGGRIAYYLSNEPLIVRNLPDYLALARAKLPNAWLMLVTNGLALNEKIGRAVLEAGLNMMLINVYSLDTNAPLPKNIVHFQQEVLPLYYPAEKIRTGNRPKEDHGIFVLQINPRFAGAILSNRGGTAPNRPSLTGTPLLGMCDQPFNAMTVTADGRAGRCCLDHFIREPMGNANDQSLSEIWNGAPFRLLRQSLLNNTRPPNSVCSVCDQVGFRWSRSKQNRFRETLLQLLVEGLVNKEPHS